MTPVITRACLAASAVLCFAIEPASAQYNIFNSQSGLVTDVIVNGIRMPLEYVEQFEQRCDIGISAGRWWRDNNGNLGREGGPALYNVNSCQKSRAKEERADTDSRALFVLRRRLDLQRCRLGHGELAVHFHLLLGGVVG